MIPHTQGKPLLMPMMVGADPVTGANWHNCDDPWGCYLQVCAVAVRVYASILLFPHVLFLCGHRG